MDISQDMCPKTMALCHTLGMEHVWPLKIVGYGQVLTASILANEHNWKIHPAAQQQALATLLTEVGLVQNLCINRRTSPAWDSAERYVETLVDGHARVLLALRHGQAMLPVTYVDLTPQEERAILLLLDHTAGMAAADEDLLSALLHDPVTQENGAALLVFFEELAGAQTAPGEAARTGTTRGQGPREVCCPACGACFIPGND
jgi:hypothetical protein